MGEEYKDFQKKKIYGCLVDYKERHITRDSGKYKGEENPWFLPEKYWDEELPAMLYDGIRETVKEIQNSEFKYKPHIFAFKHVASSQTACVNLFVPIMESESVNDILKVLRLVLRISSAWLRNSCSTAIDLSFGTLQTRSQKGCWATIPKGGYGQ